MLDKLETSWRLVKASGDVLMADGRLLLFPLMSGVATLAVAVSFLAPLAVLSGMGWDVRGAGWMGLVGIFLFYLVQYAVIFFFNSALVGAALLRLEGREPTLRDGLELAWSRLEVILGYALVSATVGLLLQALSQRSGLLGKLLTSALGLGWTLATYLTVPVLVTQRVGPISAIEESALLLRRTWGEQVAGHVGMGVVFGLAGAVLGALLALGVVGAASLGVFALVPAVVIAGVTLILFGLVTTALKEIYCAALYRYATTGEGGWGFDARELERAFRGR